jgi:hypothetical protein
VCAFLAVLAPPAGAFERVTDTGFDAATCTATGCTSTAWSQSRTPGTYGPICSAQTLNCLSGGGYTTFYNWVRLGAGNTSDNTSAVQQTVQIPAAPAKLTFALLIRGAGIGTMRVTINGTDVFTATDTTPGYTDYHQVTVDVSRFAGGARVLRFEGHTSDPATPLPSPSRIFDIDDVKLDAPEAPPPPNRDVDADGFVGSPFGGPDCNDANPAIHPGANDVPHDGIDQDCTGRDATYPSLGANAVMSVLWYARYTKVINLKVFGAPAGAKILLSCATKKRGCKFKSKTIAVKTARTLQLAKLLRKAKLRRNAVVTVRVSKPGYISAVFRFTIRIRKDPVKKTLCSPPGTTKTQKTCS